MAVVTQLSIVNGHAERAVAIVQEFFGRLLKYENQFQYLLKLVADNRKKSSKASKKALLGDNECLANMIPLPVSS